MASFGGPNIVKDGLVLSLDAGSERSFRGEPTTNLIPNADTMSGWSNYYRTTSRTEFITEFGTTGYRFTNQPSWNGMVRGFNLVNTGTYTFSAWIRYLGGSASNNGATVYISNYGAGDTVTAINKSIVGKWQRISKTVNVTSPGNVLFYLISYGGVDNGTGNPDFSSWEVTMPQIEQKSYTTPFVNGTRGTTVATGGGIADLTGTGNHGELVNAPTFNADNFGSIRFDGTNESISIAETSTLNILSYTYAFWIRRRAAQSSSFLQLLQRSTSGRNPGMWFFPNEINRIHFSIRISNNTNTSNNPGGFFLNEWHYFTATVNYNGTNTIITTYTDGVIQDSSTLAGVSPLTGTGNSFIGRQLFDLGNFKICNRALTSNEVLQNYNAGKSRYGL